MGNILLLLLLKWIGYYTIFITNLLAMEVIAILLTRIFLFVVRGLVLRVHSVTTELN